VGLKSTERKKAMKSNKCPCLLSTGVVCPLDVGPGLKFAPLGLVSGEGGRGVMTFCREPGPPPLLSYF